MNIGVIGAGRIGKVHAQNIAQFVPELTIKTLADPFADNEIKAFAERYKMLFQRMRMIFCKMMILKPYSFARQRIPIRNTL